MLTWARNTRISFWMLSDIQLSLHCSHSPDFGIAYVRSIISFQSTPYRLLWLLNESHSLPRNFIDLNISFKTVLAVFCSFSTMSGSRASMGILLSEASILTDYECMSDNSCWLNFEVALRQLQNPPAMNTFVFPSWCLNPFSRALQQEKQRMASLSVT